MSKKPGLHLIQIDEEMSRTWFTEIVQTKDREARAYESGQNIFLLPRAAVSHATYVQKRFPSGRLKFWEMA